MKSQVQQPNELLCLFRTFSVRFFFAERKPTKKSKPLVFPLSKTTARTQTSHWQRHRDYRVSGAGEWRGVGLYAVKRALSVPAHIRARHLQQARQDVLAADIQRAVGAALRSAAALAVHLQQLPGVPRIPARQAHQRREVGLQQLGIRQTSQANY
jgi:hypothetical protein